MPPDPHCTNFPHTLHTNMYWPHRCRVAGYNSATKYLIDPTISRKMRTFYQNKNSLYCYYSIWWLALVICTCQWDRLVAIVTKDVGLMNKLNKVLPGQMCAEHKCTLIGSISDNEQPFINKNFHHTKVEGFLYLSVMWLPSKTGWPRPLNHL